MPVIKKILHLHVSECNYVLMSLWILASRFCIKCKLNKVYKLKCDSLITIYET